MHCFARRAAVSLSASLATILGRKAADRAKFSRWKRRRGRGSGKIIRSIALCLTLQDTHAVSTNDQPCPGPRPSHGNVLSPVKVVLMCASRAVVQGLCVAHIHIVTSGQ